MEKLKMSEATHTKHLARILRKVDFFAPMTVGQLEMVLPYIMLYRFAKGERVFKQGGKGDAFYIIYEGAVSIRVKKGLLSFSKKVATLGPGDFFGEMALLSRKPRSATVTCEEETKLFVLLSADFETVAHQNPSFAGQMSKIAERRRFMSAHEK